MSGLNRELKYKDFFKEIERGLLLEILARRGFTPQEPLYKATQEADDVAIIQSYEALERSKKEPISQIIKEINDFDDEEQMELLVGVANKLGLPKENKTPLNLAASLYLVHPDQFEYLHAALKVTFSKSYTGFKAELQELKLNKSKIEKLEKDFSQTIEQAEYGSKVKIEEYYQLDRTILVCWLEGYTQQVKEFDSEDNSNRIVSKPIRPVQEATLIYYPDSGALYIKARNKFFLDSFRRSFAKICFANEELFEDESCRECLRLELFKALNLPLPFDESKIAGVQIVGLKVKVHWGIVFTLEIRAGRERNIFEQLKYQNIDVKGDRAIEILKIWLQFKFANRKLRQKTITLSSPNHIGIDNTEVGNIIRECIADWGVIGTNEKAD